MIRAWTYPWKRVESTERIENMNYDSVDITDKWQSI